MSAYNGCCCYGQEYCNLQPHDQCDDEGSHISNSKDYVQGSVMHSRRPYGVLSSHPQSASGRKRHRNNKQPIRSSSLVHRPTVDRLSSPRSSGTSTYVSNFDRTSIEHLPMLIFSMEAGTYVYARMKVSSKTSEPHRRSMDVGTKIDEDQCFSMEVDTRVHNFLRTSMEVSARIYKDQCFSMEVGTKIDEFQGKHVNERKSVPGQNSIGNYVRPIESNRHRNRLAGSA